CARHADDGGVRRQRDIEDAKKLLWLASEATRQNEKAFNRGVDARDIPFQPRGGLTVSRPRGWSLPAQPERDHVRSKSRSSVRKRAESPPGADSGSPGR